MEYYNNNSGDNYNGYSKGPNNYYFQYNAAKENERKALKKAAGKLGATLIIYSAFIRIFVIVYYFLAYAYYSHEISLNYNVVVSFLRDNPDIYNSSMFSMVCNIFVVAMSLTMTILIDTLVFKIDFSEMITHQKGLVKQGFKWFPACMVINFGVSFAVGVFMIFMSNFGITVPEADFTISNPNIATVIVQLFYVCILGPIAEEFIYRGVIISLLKPFGKWLAVVVSAAIFGLMHGNIPQAVGAFCSALVFGLIAVKFNSIIPTIVIHMLNNLVGSYQDVYKILDLPYFILPLMRIVLILVGGIIIITQFKNLKIGQEYTAMGKTSDKCIAVFTSVPVAIYVLYMLLKYVSSFIIANF